MTLPEPFNRIDRPELYESIFVAGGRPSDLSEADYGMALIRMKSLGLIKDLPPRYNSMNGNVQYINGPMPSKFGEQFRELMKHDE